MLPELGPLRHCFDPRLGLGQLCAVGRLFVFLGFSLLGGVMVGCPHVASGGRVLPEDLFPARGYATEQDRKGLLGELVF